MIRRRLGHKTFDLCLDFQESMFYIMEWGQALLWEVLGQQKLDVQKIENYPFNNNPALCQTFEISIIQ